MRRRLALLLIRLYVFLFARKGFQWFHHGLFTLALRGRGYNNYSDYSLSGERTFVKTVLAAANPVHCMDIGANTGSFTELVLESTAATVIAIEPLTEAYSQLQRLQRKYRDRIIAMNCAVGDAHGQSVIYYGAADSEHASLSPEANQVPYVKNTNQQNVTVQTVDEIVRQLSLTRLDFIKIDTEGFEEKVLRGAQHTLNTLKPAFIQLEFNWHQMFVGNTLWHFSRLLPGYRPYQLLPGGWHPVDVFAPINNVFLFSNFVFVRTDER
ncbi:MAG TPA: FkbM family methyltransferase [Candidatus Angelobacter sp.]|nr:FkbM family methyltransferase [Candidatus Angelobacter sp.]